jgi:hypothetical protein
MKIKLFNRDGAELYLVKSNNEIEPHIFEWSLEVDRKHNYVLNYCRYIGDFTIQNNKVVDWSKIEAIDPAGGPFISLGDEFEGKYKIVKINSANSIWISERDNN